MRYVILIALLALAGCYEGHGLYAAGNASPWLSTVYAAQGTRGSRHKSAAIPSSFSNAYSYELNGTDETLYAADHDDFECDGEDKLTFGGWFKQDSYSDGEAYGAKWRHSTQNTWACATYHANRRVLCYVGSACNDAGSNYVYTGDGSVPASGWYHMVFVYDGSLAAANRAKVYINGSSEAVTVGGTIPATLQDCANWFSVGSWDVNGSLDRYWGAGNIDEIYMGCEALSAANVSTWYNGGTPANSQSLFSDLRVHIRADGDTMPTASNSGSAGDLTGQNMAAGNLVADVP